MLEQLQGSAVMLGYELTPERLSLFERFRAEILDWNERVNLTSVTDPTRLRCATSSTP